MSESHEFRVRREGARHVARCTCGWQDRESFAQEDSAWEAWDEHREIMERGAP